MTRRARQTVAAQGAAGWLQEAVAYELSVRSFQDGNGDGVGDFEGLTHRLDYLQDLGITALWLQPFYPSPLRDGGYDVADLTSVDPACGTLPDFRAFLRAAHQRGLRVVAEIVPNHTSIDHPWFELARRAPPGSAERGRYVWSEDPRRYAEAPVLLKGAESSNWTWDPVARASYWHRFHAHEPDLNFESALVREGIREAVDFWLGAGLDGVRLAAVSYLFERDGTTCEDLPETHAFLRELRRMVDERHPGCALLTEANLWPEEAVAYFGQGDECHLVSHTSLTPRLFTGLHVEDRTPILEVLQGRSTPPAGGRWALYLRSHDELALQAVTEEERDVMYRAYAPEPRARIGHGIRRRLAPLLANDRRRIELLTSLVLSLPGTPILYYGDEIGMGDNVHLGDREGVRTPMQWSADTNAGFSTAAGARLFLPPVVDSEYSFAAVNVAAQQGNLSSLLWWMRRAVTVRRRHPALVQGDLTVLDVLNGKVLAFVRTHAEEAVLVVANLSRFAQHVELDLSAWAGARPVEVFGQAEFPPVGPDRYPLAIGPRGFYWFALEAPSAPAVAPGAEEPLPELGVAGAWREVLRGRARSAFEGALPRYLMGRRWFGGKARRIRAVELTDAIPVPAGGEEDQLALVEVSYTQGESETYALPLGFATGEAALSLHATSPGAELAGLTAGRRHGVLYAADRDPDFARALLDAIARGRRLPGAEGEVVARATRVFRTVAQGAEGLEPVPLSAEQSNTSIRFGDRMIMKLFRRAEAGPNPDLEVGAFLTEIAGFTHTPPVLGGIEYRPRRGEAMTLALLQGFVPNQGDAWSFSTDAVARFFERLAATGADREAAPLPAAPLLDLASAPGSWRAAARTAVGAYLDAAALLGQRTAELHLALASHPELEAFAPEGFSRSDQRAMHQSLRSLVATVFQLLRRRADGLDPAARARAGAVLDGEGALLGRVGFLLERPLTALRTRTHGDYHLGQVLWTGKDFVIIDFEGEPARTLATRRAKRSPLRDVAGMLRSFHYAAHQGLSGHAARGFLRPEHAVAAEAWARTWHAWVSGAYLGAYLETAKGAPFLPEGRDELRGLLDLHLAEKAVYELSYELNNRPGWVGLPLQGIVDLLGSGPGESPAEERQWANEPRATP